MTEEVITIYTEPTVPIGDPEPNLPARIVYVAGGNEYPMISAPLCKVCQSIKWRGWVEEKVMAGYTPVTIANRLATEDDESGLSSDNIYSHAYGNDHMSIKKVVGVHVNREAALANGINLMEDQGSVGSFMTMAKIGIQRVLDNLAKDESYVPTIQEGVSLGNLLLKAQTLEKETQDSSNTVQAMLLIRDAVMQVCTPEQAAAIGQYVSSGGKTPLPATVSSQPSTSGETIIEVD